MVLSSIDKSAVALCDSQAEIAVRLARHLPAMRALVFRNLVDHDDSSSVPHVQTKTNIKQESVLLSSFAAPDNVFSVKSSELVENIGQKQEPMESVVKQQGPGNSAEPADNTLHQKRPVKLSGSAEKIAHGEGSTPEPVKTRPSAPVLTSPSLRTKASLNSSQQHGQRSADRSTMSSPTLSTASDDPWLRYQVISLDPSLQQEKRRTWASKLKRSTTDASARWDRITQAALRDISAAEAREASYLLQHEKYIESNHRIGVGEQTQEILGEQRRIRRKRLEAAAKIERLFDDRDEQDDQAGEPSLDNVTFRDDLPASSPDLDSVHNDQPHSDHGDCVETPPASSSPTSTASVPQQRLSSETANTPATDITGPSLRAEQLIQLIISPKDQHTHVHATSTSHTPSDSLIPLSIETMTDHNLAKDHSPVTTKTDSGDCSTHADTVDEQIARYADLLENTSVWAPPLPFRRWLQSPWARD